MGRCYKYSKGKNAKNKKEMLLLDQLVAHN